MKIILKFQITMEMVYDETEAENFRMVDIGIKA